MAATKNMKSCIGCVFGCEFPKLYCFIIFLHLWAAFKNISETKSLSSEMWFLQLYSGIAIFWPSWSLGLSWHLGCHCLTDGDKTCHWFDTRWQPPDKLDHRRLDTRWLPLDKVLKPVLLWSCCWWKQRHSGEEDDMAPARRHPTNLSVGRSQLPGSTPIVAQTRRVSKHFVAPPRTVCAGCD